MWVPTWNSFLTRAQSVRMVVMCWGVSTHPEKLQAFESLARYHRDELHFAEEGCLRRCEACRKRERHVERNVENISMGNFMINAVRQAWKCAQLFAIAHLQINGGLVSCFSSNTTFVPSTTLVAYVPGRLSLFLIKNVAILDLKMCCDQNKKRKKGNECTQKHTATGIRWSSPTQLLPNRYMI